MEDAEGNYRAIEEEVEEEWEDSETIQGHSQNRSIHHLFSETLVGLLRRRRKPHLFPMPHHRGLPGSSLFWILFIGSWD